MALLAARMLYGAVAFAGALKLLDERSTSGETSRRRLDDIKRQLKAFDAEELPAMEAFLEDEAQLLFEHYTFFSDTTHEYHAQLKQDCHALRVEWVRLDEEVYHHPPKRRDSAVWKRIRALEKSIGRKNERLNWHLRLYQNSKNNDRTATLIRHRSYPPYPSGLITDGRQGGQLALPAPEPRRGSASDVSF